MPNNYKLFLSGVCSLLMGLYTHAQTIPNAGFENWHTAGFPSYNEPDNWGTLNSSTAIIGVYTVEKGTGAGNFHSGSSSIKCSTHYISFASQTAPGITVSSATINTNTQQIDGGFPYTQRPTHLVGWYKGTPAAHDSGSVELNLWKWDGTNHVRIDIGEARFSSSVTVGSFTRFMATITYSSAQAPDSALITISSSDPFAPVDGSVFFVDDLAFLDCSAFNATTTSTSTICTSPSGIASVSATGATTYHWSNNASTATINNVAAGTYTVTVSDANGCSASSSVVVSSTNYPVNPSATSTNAICTANGTATGNAVAGSAPYTYLWSNNGNTQTITGLGANTYTVTITDNLGCTGTASTTVSSSTTNISSTIMATSTQCGSNTGSATVTPTNGTASYTYHWNNNQSTAGITGLGAGGYQVTITDANGCTGTASTSVNTPNGPSATQTSASVYCHGMSNGSVDVTTTGGTGNISYIWNSGATTEDLSGVAAGTYTLTITDANNCSFTITSTVTEPAVLQATGVATNITCFGAGNGGVDLSVTGGTPNYLYNWGGAGSTQDLSNLAAGNYTVTVQDNRDCTASATFSITEPAQLTVTSTTVNVLCHGGNNGSITITPAGGTAPYTPNWSSGNGTSLVAGTYTVTVTDDNSCSVTITSTIAEPSALTASATVADASTSSSSDGSITVTPAGGTAPYTTTWNSGNGSNLAPGSYTYTVTDNNGCTTSHAETVGFGSGITSIDMLNAKLYPNPANGQVVIESGSGDKFVFSVYSIEGKLLNEMTISGNKTIVDVKILPVGFYSYQLRNTATGKIAYGKLQIQR